MKNKQKEEKIPKKNKLSKQIFINIHSTKEKQNKSSIRNLSQTKNTHK